MRKSTTSGYRLKSLATLSIVLVAILLSFYPMPEVTATARASGNEIGVWEIRSFKSEIRTTEKDEIEVKETIDAYFFVERRGIFRSIPYKYDDGKGNIKLSVQSVTDENGKPHPYSTATYGDFLEIKIGDADIYISGEQTYVISYTASNVIDYYDTAEELFWNATGNQWPVPINSATAIVTAPPTLQENQISDIQTYCYTGAYGSKATDCTIEQDGFDTIFTSNNPFSIQEGMSIVVEYPKGTIRESTFLEKYGSLMLVNVGVCFPFFAFPIAFLVWRRHGKDPKGRGTIVPEFDAPEGMSPAEVGVLVDNNADHRDITATVIDLAIRGYIKIEELPKGAVSKQDYKFHLVNESFAELREYEVLIMNGIFGGSPTKGDAVQLTSLENKFYTTMNSASENLYEKVVSDGYYTRKPRSMIGGMAMVGGVIIGVAVFAASILIGIGAYLTMCGLIVSGLILAAFSPLMSQRTDKGAMALEHIKGLKMYLEIAEEDRLKTMQGPDSDYVTNRKAPVRDVKLFEKLLPYAMVLKVESAWAAKFKDIYKELPDWYSSGSFNTINTIYLVNSLSAASSTMNSSFASQPRSSGGGGFSGGGGGGGGGGSW